MKDNGWDPNKKFDTAGFCCWNEECPDYGKKDQVNIVPKEQYGKHGMWMLRCRTCEHAYSYNHETSFFNLNTSKDEVLRTLSLILEKGSIRGAASASGHDKNAVIRWTNVAGEHCQKVNEYFLQDLDLDQVQIDEIWSYIKK